MYNICNIFLSYNLLPAPVVGLIKKPPQGMIQGGF